MSENGYFCDDCHSYHLIGTKPCLRDDDLHEKLDYIIEMLEGLTKDQESEDGD